MSKQVASTETAAKIIANACFSQSGDCEKHGFGVAIMESLLNESNDKVRNQLLRDLHRESVPDNRDDIEQILSQCKILYEDELLSISLCALR